MRLRGSGIEQASVCCFRGWRQIHFNILIIILSRRDVECVAGAHILHYKDETGLHFLIANFVVRKVRRTTQPLAHNIFHLPAIAFNFEDEAL